MGFLAPYGKPLDQCGGANAKRKQPQNIKGQPDPEHEHGVSEINRVAADGERPLRHEAPRGAIRQDVRARPHHGGHGPQIEAEAERNDHASAKDDTSREEDSCRSEMLQNET